MSAALRARNSQPDPVAGRAAVRESIVRLINEIAKVPVEQVTDTATVDKDLRMESVTFVELHVAIEDEFQVEIDLLRVVELNRFGAIVDYVCECLANGGQ
jgi:acyl carrier protein